MCEIEKLVDEFVCDLYCPLNCCLESEGGLFTVGDYESAKRLDGKTMCDGSVFHLQESLENVEEGMRFRQDENGVCIFLQDGKCVLQASFGRKALPYECREYPRNVLHYMGHTDKMLDPVCPHAAKLLIDAQTPFWDYMIQVIEPDPEGLFAKRREMILTLQQKGPTLAEAMNRISDMFEIRQSCVVARQFPEETDAILRHLFACMLFGNLFYYGYEKAVFERQAKLDIIVSAGMIETLSRKDDLKRDNLPLYFNRAFYENYNILTPDQKACIFSLSR